MQPSNEPDDRGLSPSLRASLTMLAFGLVVLAYLVAIDHPQWFHIRPITGTASAMSAAANADI